MTETNATRAAGSSGPACSHISFREAWSRVLGLAEWAEMIRIHMDNQAKLRKIGSANSSGEGRKPAQKGEA